MAVTVSIFKLNLRVACYGVYYIHLFNGCSLVNDASPHYRTYDLFVLFVRMFVLLSVFFVLDGGYFASEVDA